MNLVYREKEFFRSDQFNRLRQFGLPAIETPDELWQFLQLRDFSELVKLADPSAVSKYRQRSYQKTESLGNYIFREIPKRCGGVRVISAPKKRLKAAQRKILHEILDKVPIHPAATAFRARYDITNHVTPHVSRKIVVAMDLRDFFPTISKARVAAFFCWLGYPPKVAHILSLLCTVNNFPNRCSRRRVLPQGAPTSPALANAIVYRLDCRMAGLAKKFGASYTRYADDLAFSGDEEFKRGLSRWVPLMRKIISEEGFRVNQAKTRFMRRGQRQRLTGLNVNHHPSVGREEIDRLKAILHNARRAGSLESQNREKVPHFADYLSGRITWIARFHPDRGSRLRAQLEALTSTGSLNVPLMPPPE